MDFFGTQDTILCYKKAVFDKTTLWNLGLVLSDSYPAFFLLITTTSNKIFKSAETVNVKFGVYEFGDKGQ